MRRREPVSVAFALCGVLLVATLVFGALAPNSTASAQEPGQSVVDRLSADHPRLLATADDFAAIRAKVSSDPASGEWYDELRRAGELVLTEPPSEYELPDGVRLLSISRQVLDRVSILGMLYQLDGDDRWAERAWTELAAAAEFPDWNPAHFLDTAEMTHAFALGYDWLYHYWTDARRAKLRDTIVEFGFGPALDGVRGNAWWVTTENNWNIVCHGGIGMGALAIGDEVPEIAEELLQAGLENLPTAIAEYAPDGAYPEGVGSYWGYATQYLTAYLAAMETAVGDDYGLSDSPGLSVTGDFPIYLTGPAGQNFNYYDAGGGTPQPPEMFWLANTYDQPAYSWWGRHGGAAGRPAHRLLWYDPENDAGPREAELPLDRYFRHSEVVTLRGAWEDPTTPFVGFKAGDNTTNHGDLDLGTFVLDALGARWAHELGGDNYNLPGYWDMGPSGQRWTYYRKRAEGQNTLVVNPGSGADQDPLGAGTITRQESGPTDAFTIADLSGAYPDDVTSWERGVRLFDHRRRVLVQDELRSDQPVDAWWFMHTLADVELGADGRSATLSLAGERMRAQILTEDESVTFSLMAPSPLWSSPNPEGQGSNSGVKLAIHVPKAQSLQLPVLFTPIRDGGEEPGADLPDVEALSQWGIGRTDVPTLDRITVDGAPLDQFAPESFTYDVEVAEGAAPPAVSAVSNDPKATVRVLPAKAVPGVTRIDLTRPGSPRTRYEVYFDTPGAGGVVTASTDDGNVPENTIDGNPGHTVVRRGPRPVDPVRPGRAHPGQSRVDRLVSGRCARVDVRRRGVR